jgi:signal transduction histidine kinase/DNA-binding response OmpR family regulator
MASLPDGRIVVAGLLDGLFVLDRDGARFERLAERDGIPVRRMTSGMHVDAHGDLWLAQERTIVRVGSGALSVFDDRHGLPSALQIARWNGLLTVASRAGLMVLRDSAEGARFESPLPSLLGLAAVARLSDEVLLVINPVLHAVRRDGEAWHVESLPVRWRTVLCLETSRFHPGRVYAGHAEGLLQIDQLADGGIRVTDIGPPGEHIVRIAEESADVLWVAGRVSGATRVVLGSDQPPRDYGAAEGLPEGTVRPFGGPRRVWFTTLDGLRVYDAARDRFVIPPGLPASLVGERLYSAYEDHEGHLWVRGGAILNDVFWREGDGWRIDRDVMHGVDPFPTIYGFHREGDVVWAVRANGLLRIDLNALRPTPAAPPPLLTEIHDTRARAQLAFAALAGLPAEVRDLRIGFALPFLRRGGATAYRSRLAGFDEWSDWVASGQQARVYTNLPDGRYTFEVEARDALQREWRMSPVSIAITPPWFRTPLAYAAYVASALLALWAAMRLGARHRARQMLARQRELEATVAARTAELRVSNQRLAEQAERLAEIDRLKTRFFINVGHEFRTPLTLVLGPIDDLLRDTRERISDRVRAQLELAQRNARRVLDLIVELLDVNRLEQGRLVLTLAPHDIRAVLARVVDEHAPLAERYGQSLVADLGGDARAACRIDPLQMERAVGNLITNAAKYSPRGSVITVSLRREDHNWAIAVHDQGRGISRDALPHVFDRFYQADGNDRASGYGIGLSLVREIALAHGGEVSASSAPGSGSTFFLRLPVLAEADAAAAAAIAGAEPAAVAGRAPAAISPNHDASDAAGQALMAGAGAARERECVLVVDDHDDMRARVRELLAHRFTVIEAADGNTAWQLARDELPDLIVSDVMMPGCDGVELTRRLRSHADTQAIGILLLTAKVGSEHAVAGLGAGANDYLDKPFDSSELLARCEAIVAHSRRLQHRLAAAAPAAPVDPPDGQDARWRQRLDQHVAAKLHESGFGVEELARAMHADRTQLFRKCKDLLGQSPSDYLRDARLAHGHRLLMQAAGNVSEVAYACGFDSLSSFTRAFKARYGLPPSQVRGRVAS